MTGKKKKKEKRRKKSTRRVGATQNTAATCGVSPQSTSHKILSCMYSSRHLSGVGIWQDVLGSNPDRAKKLSLLLKVQTGSEDHPGSYSMGSENSWIGGKWAGA